PAVPFEWLLRARRGAVPFKFTGQRLPYLWGERAEQFFSRQPLQAFLWGESLQAFLRGQPLHTFFRREPLQALLDGQAVAEFLRGQARQEFVDGLADEFLQFIRHVGFLAVRLERLLRLRRRTVRLELTRDGFPHL